MSAQELTPERIRDAAEVLRQLNAARYPAPFASRVYVDALGIYADTLESEQAAESKRERRVEELAEWLADTMPWSSGWSMTGHREEIRMLSRALLDRYPALAEAVQE